MKAFTIGNEVKQGLRIIASTESVVPQLIIGFGERAMRIDTSELHSHVFSMCVAKDVLQREVGADHYEAIIDDVNLSLIAQDLKLVYDPQVSAACIVHVEPVAGVGGKLWYESGSFDEVLHNGHVERRYHAFPPPGVEIWGTGHDQNDEVHHLLLMLPRAHFRIRRTGQMPLDWWQYATVTWTGYQLRFDIPMREKTRIERVKKAEIAA